MSVPTGGVLVQFPLDVPAYSHSLRKTQQVTTDVNIYIYIYTYILPSKIQHMYINTVMKYQLHQGYMYRP